MIVINKNLADKVVDNAFASGRVNEISNSKSWLIQATVHLNRVYDVGDFVDKRLPKYKEKEFAAAEAIHWLIAYLRIMNCSDIEQLLRDVAEYRQTHPDYLTGSWPY